MWTEDNAEQIELLIRSAEASSARASLERVVRTSIPRRLCARLAELARRAGAFHLSLRLLAPLVRPAKSLAVPASARERAEYALALIKVGAVPEGRELLMAIDPREAPTGQLYLGLSYFPEWDYARGIPHLESFIAAKAADDYTLLIAKVNLTAAYTQTRRPENEAALDELLREGLATTARHGHRLLNANFLELSAQRHLMDGRFENATQNLDEAGALLAKSGLYDELFVRKWRALVEAHRHPHNAHATLEGVRNEAARQKHWETLRDLDFHLAKLTRSSELYHQLYFGTPHLAFRESLAREFSDLPPPPSSYEWSFGQPLTKQIFDVTRAELDGHVTSLKTGQLLQKLLLELTSDFYRPIRLAALAAALFDGQYYDPLSTPNRIQQLIGRLRTWFKESELSLAIEEMGGAYRLTGEMTIRVSTSDSIALSSAIKGKLVRLNALVAEKSFTVQEAASRTGSSASTVLRWLNAGLTSGHVEKNGAAATTSYRFVKKLAS